MIIFAILGGLIGLVAFGVGLWSGITLLVIIFRNSVMWGCATFIPIIGPFAWIAFVVSHWEEVKKPFLINLAASGGMIIAVVLFGIASPGSTGPFSDDPFALESEYESQYDSDDGGGFEAEDFFADDDDAADFFSQPTPEPYPTRAPMVLNRSPIPTMTPRMPSPTPFPSPTPLPLDLISNHVGQYLELTLKTGDVFPARLIEVDGGKLLIERRLGGGSMRFTVPSDDVERFRVIR